MDSSPEPDSAGTAEDATLTERMDALLRFGALMLRTGDTAFRVRQSMMTVARGMGLENVFVQMGLGWILATARRGEEATTLMREVGAPGVNAWRIGALVELADRAATGIGPRELLAKLAEIEGARPRYSVVGTAAAVGAACGAFAVLNGGVGLEVWAAAVGGGVGQCLRSALLRRRFNQYGVTAVTALVASGVYCLVAVLARYAGLGAARHSVGFISSVLFLVPGFPLIATLLDFLQHETAVAVGRLAYVTVLVLAASFGLAAVVEVVGFVVEAPPPPLYPIALPARVVLRGVASVVGACGFAILYNGSWRNVLHVGVLALVGNEVRLALRDAGLPLPGATFFGAVAVGLAASLVRRWFDVPRIALTVPAVIMMVPGLYAFRMLVLFHEGEVLEGWREAVLTASVVGAMAMGLAAARLASEPEWVRE